MTDNITVSTEEIQDLGAILNTMARAIVGLDKGTTWGGEPVCQFCKMPLALTDHTDDCVVLVAEWWLE